jgi:hypothetical protein
MTIFIATILLGSGKIECEPEWRYIVYVYFVELAAGKYYSAECLQAFLICR